MPVRFGRNQPSPCSVEIKRDLLVLLVLALLAGCAQPEPRGSDTVEPTIASFDEETWRAELLEHRAEKDEEFKTSTTSPMAGTQYLKSEPRDRVFLTRDGKTFDLAYEPEDGAVLEVEKKEGSWHWQPLEPGAILRQEDETVANPEALDGPALFIAGNLRLSVYPAEERITFIVFDPERPEMTSFEHLYYYPPDARYAVSSRLTELGEPEELVMLTSRNLEKTFYRFARIRFALDGQQHELTAFKVALEGDGSKMLFIPFRDATSGKETYGAGRFMEIEVPDEELFVFDFNRAFSPLCNYSPAYNCAIPPPENHLEVALRAGEKTYLH